MNNKNYIFQIGFNKCATMTLHTFFIKNNLKSLHWLLNDNKTPIDNIIINNKNKYNELIKNEHYTTLNLLDGIDEYNVFTDSEEIRKNFKLLEKIYPEAKFILNIRDVNEWVCSRLNHQNGNYTKYLNNVNKTNYTNEEFIKIWKNEWIEHCDDVINYFENKKDKLLIYDIDKDNFDKIINFLPKNNLKYFDIHAHDTKKMYDTKKYVYDKKNNTFKLD